MNAIFTQKKIRRFYLLSLLFFTFYFVLSSCKNSTSPPTNNGPDTTSHNFSWVIDTLEFPEHTSQIIPYGIWGSDTNDVWIVGHADYWRSRIWHWDGESWQPWKESGLGVRPADITGFAKDDIWLCGGRIGDQPLIKTIQHWDGNSWNIVQHNIETHIMSIWGSSSQNLYFGLYDGRIAHYDGNSFEIINTNTNSQITHITGDLDNNVYAIGSKSDSTGQHHWIFKIENTSFKVLNYYYNTADNGPLPFPSHDINIIDNYIYGVNGKTVYYLDDKNVWNPVFEPYKSSGAWQINGSSINNIFISGYRGRNIFHYNGSTWSDFDEINDNLLFYGTGIQVFNNHVFLIGYNDKALILRGKRHPP